MWDNLFRKNKDEYSYEKLLKILSNPEHSQFERVQGDLYKKLFRKYFNKVKSWFLLFDSEDRKSAFNDAFVSLLLNIESGKFDRKQYLGSYFYRIFQNNCVNYYRDYIAENNTHRHTSFKDPENLGDISTESISIIATYTSQHNIDLIWKIINGMKDICREILTSSAKGWTVDVIAERLSINKETAKKRLTRCRAKLGPLLKEKIEY